MPTVRGVTLAEPLDEEEAYQRATAEWRKTERLAQQKREQVIRFPFGPVGIVFAADLHLGGDGVDYPRCYREARIVAETPGLWLVLGGDLLDNFIVGKLMSARYNNALAKPQQEWALVRRYLRIVAPKLVASVAGNHEHWSWLLTGVDYFADVLREIKPDCIYDPDDALIDLRVGPAHFPLRIRHRWTGRSIYNLTHGIERASAFDGDFIVGVGGHDHAAGVVRTINAHGRNGIAVQCGSYKRIDPFAKHKGFAKPNASTAMTVIFYENGAMVGIDRLEVAAELMGLYYRKRKR